LSRHILSLSMQILRFPFRQDLVKKNHFSSINSIQDTQHIHVLYDKTIKFKSIWQQF
jgi:hypothetical protein